MTSIEPLTDGQKMLLLQQRIYSGVNQRRRMDLPDPTAILVTGEQRMILINESAPGEIDYRDGVWSYRGMTLHVVKDLPFHLDAPAIIDLTWEEKAPYCRRNLKSFTHSPINESCECGHSGALHGDDGCGVCIVQSVVAAVRHGRA